MDCTPEGVAVLVSRLRQNFTFYNENMPEEFKLKIKIGVAFAMAGNLLSVEELLAKAESNPV